MNYFFSPSFTYSHFFFFQSSNSACVNLLRLFGLKWNGDTESVAMSAARKFSSLCRDRQICLARYIGFWLEKFFEPKSILHLSEIYHSSVHWILQTNLARTSCYITRDSEHNPKKESATLSVLNWHLCFSDIPSAIT